VSRSSGSSVSNEVIRHETSDFFREASARFNDASFRDALAAVPDVPAKDDDRLSPQRRVAEARSPYGNGSDAIEPAFRSLLIADDGGDPEPAGGRHGNRDDVELLQQGVQFIDFKTAPDGEQSIVPHPCRRRGHS